MKGTYIFLWVYSIALWGATSATPRDLQWRFSDTTNNLRAAACGGGTIVSVGESGTIVSSTDTVLWQVRNSRTKADLCGVCYGNGMFVAAGGTTGAEILTSPDGLEWTRQTTPVTNRLKAVTWGASRFVAVGEQGTILTSTDGANWSRRPTVLAKSLYGVMAGNTYQSGPLFIAVGEGGTLLTSPDGLAWTVRNSGVLLDLYCATSVDTRRGDSVVFVAAGAEGIGVASGDGVNWNAIALPTEQDVYAAAGAGALGNGAVGHFALAGGGGTFLSSDDGNSWANYKSGTTATLRGLLHLNGGFLAVGDGGTIRCGLVFLPRNSTVTTPLNSITWGNGRYVAVGENGTVVFSQDGTSWMQTSVGTQSLYSVTYGSGRFVAVGDRFSVYSSTNGFAWTASSVPVPANFFYDTRILDTVAYGNGSFLASGYYSVRQLVGGGPPYSNIVTFSSDGLNWRTVTGQSQGCSGYYLRVSAGPNVFLLSGVGLLSSGDGSAWTKRVPSTYFSRVRFGADCFVALSEYTFDGQPIAVSKEDMNWSTTTLGTPVPFSGMAFGEGSFLTVGKLNGVSCFAVSANGTDWIRGVFTADNVTDVTYGDRTFVAVGKGGLILQSLPTTSRPKLRIARAGQNSSLDLISEPGRTIRVESSRDLTHWSPETTLIITQDLTQVNFPLSTSGGKFFRLVAP